MADAAARTIPDLEVRAAFTVTPPPPPCPDHVPAVWSCRRCRARKTWMHHTRGAAIRAGVWEGRVDATQTREHLLRLHAAGLAWPAIARRCGVSAATLKRIAGGRGQELLADSRRRILAVPLPARPAPPLGMVHPHGALRMMRGLCLQGWPQRELTRRCRAGNLSGLTCAEYITEATAAKVRALAEELAGVPGPSRIAAERAAAKGWVPIDWWADINDPESAVLEPSDPDDPADDWVIVSRMLAGAGVVAQPEPCRLHRKGRAPGCRPCRERRTWLRCRDEAVRAGSLPAPVGRGLSAERLAEMVGVPARTVQRVRERLGLTNGA